MTHNVQRVPACDTGVCFTFAILKTHTVKYGVVPAIPGLLSPSLIESHSKHACSATFNRSNSASSSALVLPVFWAPCAAVATVKQSPVLFVSRSALNECGGAFG